MGLLWGVDLGGTKVEGVVVDAATPGAPLARTRIATESAKGYQHILGQIARVIDDLSTVVGERPTTVGIGTPGALDPATGTLKNSNTQCLNGAPFDKDLSAILGTPLIVSNDANCFALAEATLGAARGAPSVFGVIMGTGVGGGLVVNGRALFGRNGVAGEWGHNVVEPGGQPCYCGKSGCVETCISGPALEAWYRAQGGAARALSEIVVRARSDEDPIARATIGRLRGLFAQALAVVINIFDPHVVVLGGGVSNIDELYEGIGPILAPYVFDRVANTPIVRHSLGDSGGVFGAALLTA